MQTLLQTWGRLGISKKFSYAFVLLVFFILLVAATVSCSFWFIRSAEEDIRKSTEIGQQVVEMDRGLERARRLLGDFFLHYQMIGLQNAHEKYAQPSVRQISLVISKSSDLEKTLFRSTLGIKSGISRTEINLYLASAKRFADTSIEAVELISRRAAPESGVESQLFVMAEELEKALAGFPRLQNSHNVTSSFCQKYLNSRQRFLMQSAFNAQDQLRLAVVEEAGLQGEQKQKIFTLMDSRRTLAEELLEVDRELAAKIRDFSLQEQMVSPVSNTLVQGVRMEVEQAQQRIDRVYRMAGFIVLSIAFSGVLVMFLIARLLHNTVTLNILRLADSASEFGKGNLDVRVPEQSEDELGQLARILNSVASRFQNLVENLEQKVVQRTADLFESESRFRYLVSDLPKIAVQGYDCERRVIYWNSASEVLYGYKAKEVMGRKLEDLIIPESMREAVVHATLDWYERGIPVPASELTLRHKDGSDVPVYSSHVMLVSSTDEKTMYCVDLGLAELKQAQEMKQINESFYRQLFEHSSSGVAVYKAVDNGNDFIFKDFNRAGEEIEGVSRESILGRRVTEVFPGVEEFGMLEVFRRVWRTGKPDYHPVSKYKDDHIQGWRENRVYKLPTGEIVAVYDDITRQKQAEEAKENVEKRLQRAKKMEAIGLMAGGVAHDLNNILSGIIGYPELLLLQLPEESELRRPIQAIQESGERAAAVVADLLTVARGVASTRTVVALNSLVKEYLCSPEYDHLHSLYPQIQWQKILAEELPGISCSPVHIKKCIMNLMTNAAEAIETSGTITLSTLMLVPDQDWSREKGLEQGQYVVLRVTDTGPGIAEKNIEHIFEPFFSKKVIGRSGTGLGLAVVWNTVKEHGGTVTVSSSEQGTTFEIFLPVAEEMVLQRQETTKNKRQKGHGETILVVDDEPQLRDIANRMLDLLGYNVACVSSGEEALAYLQDRQVDLVLLDMLMEPGINGHQTYKQILKIHPGQKAVVASGFSESDDVKATLHLGACGFVKKPYSMAELSMVVQKGLSSWDE